MGSIGPAEILVVLVAALIILGPKRLPDAAKQVGRAFTEFRRVTSGFQSELRSALDEVNPAKAMEAAPPPSPAPARTPPAPTPPPPVPTYVEAPTTEVEAPASGETAAP